MWSDLWQQKQSAGVFKQNQMKSLLSTLSIDLSRLAPVLKMKGSLYQARMINLQFLAFFQIKFVREHLGSRGIFTGAELASLTSHRLTAPGLLRQKSSGENIRWLSDKIKSLSGSGAAIMDANI